MGKFIQLPRDTRKNKSSKIINRISKFKQTKKKKEQEYLLSVEKDAQF